ncbi:hypothetical protein [Bacillus solimangrovi]|uniref:Uncharacterized protein n=1 Tax=Bacillus solimangrovi TaxID=1305675 RepID=A0A1E5LD52_9BACI|nr:hypothetical protein [Bacillus solimangrovi]OEH92004.1 hypothetical protein BFG57_17215 [Bacillus solimangrovi]
MYYWHSNPYQHPYFVYFIPLRTPNTNITYPPVTVSKFKKSIEQLTPMLKQTELFSKRLIENETLRKQIKDAAQKGNKKEVESLIRTAGLTDLFRISYTPDTIHILIHPKTSDVLSDIVLTLPW